jgi:hypothetical protein
MRNCLQIIREIKRLLDETEARLNTARQQTSRTLAPGRMNSTFTLRRNLSATSLELDFCRQRFTFRALESRMIFINF